MATSYFEKLRDPRWQRRRLEIMQRADFACEDCDAREKTLNVHHKLYRKGADPWDYADDELVCLCEDCHETRHKWKERLDRAIAAGYVTVEALVGYAEAKELLCNPDRPEITLKLESHEHAEGVGGCFSIRSIEVFESADANYMVSGRGLWDAFHAKWFVRGMDA